ncbi:hypothetical protein K504DRAFT_456172 [Pleomassaria siparia CBS 279.74]|uniref:Uncharacterized protein n=1 Tax=Pleomassaria siparia CBS 279.74 TaxID=1314801 RepID=A0A6G1K6N6_9PLEO|nr:hypothetical protein K504DRAFT_456172 [Pleomassaria siparia CBS 279.74]
MNLDKKTTEGMRLYSCPMSPWALGLFSKVLSGSARMTWPSAAPARLQDHSAKYIYMASGNSEEKSYPKARDRLNITSSSAHNNRCCLKLSPLNNKTRSDSEARKEISEQLCQVRDQLDSGAVSAFKHKLCYMYSSRVGGAAAALAERWRVQMEKDGLMPLSKELRRVRLTDVVRKHDLSHVFQVRTYWDSQVVKFHVNNGDPLRYFGDLEPYIIGGFKDIFDCRVDLKMTVQSAEVLKGIQV